MGPWNARQLLHKFPDGRPIITGDIVVRDG